MTSRVSTWLRVAEGRKAREKRIAREERKAAEEGPPGLPAVRPRALSISNGTTIDTNEEKKEQKKEAPSLFDRLPYELRRRILLEAFGDQTVHLDLRMLHPPLKERRETVSYTSDDLHTFSGTRLPRDETKARRWEWWSSVCHRNPPFWHHEESRHGGGPEPTEIWKDRCRDGMVKPQREDQPELSCADWLPKPLPGGWEEVSEEVVIKGSTSSTGSSVLGHIKSIVTTTSPANSAESPPKRSHKCHIGIIGWLQSCRQAYVEGIDVLYGANRFFIDGTYLTAQLPRLLLPSRLAQIREVEFAWQLREHVEDPEARFRITNEILDGSAGLGHPRERGGQEAFRELLAALPNTLPNLRLVHISVTGYLIHSRSRLSPLLVLEPIDELVNAFCDRQEEQELQPFECRVWLKEWLYSEYNYQIFRVYHDHQLQRGRIWRSLIYCHGPFGNNAGRISHPEVRSESGPTAGARGERGYWIHKGEPEYDHGWCGGPHAPH